jgi:parallel beta-helix repeat protein
MVASSKIGIIFISLIIILISSSSAKLITVGPKDCDYSSISIGIYHASPGDLVEVKSGTYRENIVIGKSVILRGVNTGLGKPIVDANYNESGITIEADGAVVDGFKIVNSTGRNFFDLWAGIKVLANDCILANNMLINNENGILIDESGNTTLKNNAAIENIYGIKLDNSRSCAVQDNDLTNNKFGVLLLSSGHNLVSGNIASGNKYGILLNSSENNVLRDNRMHNNSFNFGARGINDVDTSNLAEERPIYYLVRHFGEVLDSTSEASSVYCIDSNNMTIRDLRLERNLDGIFLDNCTGSSIYRCSLSNNSYGIYLKESRNVNVTSNKIENNIVGIEMISSHNNSVTNNTISKNKVDGIEMQYSEDNAIKYNRLNHNGNSTCLIRSNRSEIISNEIAENTNAGLLLFKSSHNNITGNDINNNQQAGISFDTSWFNVISNNDILGNDVGIGLIGGIHNSVTANNISMNQIGVLQEIYDDSLIDQNTKIGNNKDEESLLPPVSKWLFESINAIKIESELKGVEVWVEGNCIGYIEDEGIVYPGDPGDHTAILKKEGYPEIKKTFNIPRDKELHIP